MRGMLVIAGLTILVTLWRAPVPTPPRWWHLGVLAALLQVPAYVQNTADWLLPVSYVLLVIVAWQNRLYPSGRLIFTGMLLNAVPIVVLGDMPISPEMLAWGGQVAVIGTELSMSKDVVIHQSPWLLLGDSIPLAVLGWQAAWSLGDVVLCCGALRSCLSGKATALSTLRGKCGYS
jgi:hypothetical protein